MKQFLCAAAALALFFTPGAASAQTASYYVSAAGNDENSGLSEEAAFKTLSHALFEASRSENIKTVTVIGTLNQASEGNDGDAVFAFASMDYEPVLITGISGAPAGRRAALSATGAGKSCVKAMFCALRFEHIEISGSSETGLEVSVDASVTLGPGSLVRNNQNSGVVVAGVKDELKGVIKSGTLILDGGIVENNKSETSGGGIAVTGAFTMKRGSVRNNTTVPDSRGNSVGGGIYVRSADPVSIEGGDITGNTADIGGGMIIFGGSVTMNGGSISGNTAKTGAGGVAVGEGTTFTQRGGTVSGNRSPKYPNIFVMKGGTANLPRASSSSGASRQSGALSDGDSGGGGGESASSSRQPWYHDSDAGVIFAGSFGGDLQYQPLATGFFGLPLQLGIGFNFLRMQIAILGEGEVSLGLGTKYEDEWLLLAGMSYGIAGEFYFPGRKIGIGAGYGFYYTDLPVVADSPDLSTVTSGYLRVDLIFKNDDMGKTSIYAMRLNDHSWAFGVRFGVGNE
jgi:predicted outer membrane repeat protein